MKTTTAVLTGTAATGGIVGGGFLANSLIYKSNTLEDHLKSKNLILISSLGSEKEGKQWSAEFELDQVEIKKYNDKIISGEKLKEWCQKNVKLELEKHEDLVPYLEKWCVLGTIESRISRSSGKELITEGDSRGWESVYNTNSAENLRTKIDLQGTKDQNSGKKDEDIKKIKAFCTANKGKTFKAEEKTSVYDVVVEWCTKTKSSSGVGGV
ncbi:hypothetical protein HF1_13370 [Mycoplasma haemofelis str. Langford 1]|uniref:Uncharacterized protein n=1 Tax=Mycoplasma haemofelis (strain Langford 1) TaxID=941640 RepID=E8ZJM4_MYCHL|nr:hypothetical protein [Mycoplasma haemofelis]CBY93345.1 hypothetical protein HF1_13370 [Mycoplasma haemofelis str. Langford 1]